MNKKSTLRSVANDYLTHPRQNSGITLVALVVTIVILLILAGVSINLVVGNNGIITQAKKAREETNKSIENEMAQLNKLANDLEAAEKVDYEGGSGNITYTDSDGKTQPLTKSTPAGTKIGTTANIDGQTLDWYLFDVSDDGKTAYLVSTPTYWVPDTTKEVSGAWVPKLESHSNNITGAMRQAIQKRQI